MGRSPAPAERRLVRGRPVTLRIVVAVLARLLRSWKGLRSASVALALVVVVGTLISALPTSRGAAQNPNVQFGPVQRDVRFGLNQAWEAADAADVAGAGWSRLTFWWSSMQPNGPSDFNVFATDRDSYIDDEVARGRELVGVVLNTPLWAGTTRTPNAVPRNLYLAWDHPENYWGQFMRRMATHYRGRIDAWIIWNEVDIRGTQWQTWDGSVEDYVQLVRVAHQAIKAGNPNAKVVLYGSPWWYDRGAYIERMLSLFAAAPDAQRNGFYFDVANLHMYSRAHDIPRILGWYRERLEAHGMSKPIWIGETNAIPYDDPLWPEAKAGFRASMDEQASYLIEAFATYLAFRVERIGINRMTDGADFEAGGEPFGLMRNNRTTRPAYEAFKVIARYLAGAQATNYLATDPRGLTAVLLERDGERITVAWTMLPEPLTVELAAVAPRALIVSRYGQTSVVEAEDGYYYLSLEGATANSNEADPDDYVIGGSPVIVVERFDGDVAAALRSMDLAPRPVIAARPPPPTATTARPATATPRGR